MHQDDRTPLHEACASGRVDVVQFLIDKGASVAVEAKPKVRVLSSPVCVIVECDVVTCRFRCLCHVTPYTVDCHFVLCSNADAIIV